MMFVFLPHPVLPRGEGIIKFSPSGRKKEGQNLNQYIHTPRPTDTPPMDGMKFNIKKKILCSRKKAEDEYMKDVFF